jgi:hypothetical protein
MIQQELNEDIWWWSRFFTWNFFSHCEHIGVIQSFIKILEFCHYAEKRRILEILFCRIDFGKEGGRYPSETTHQTSTRSYVIKKNDVILNGK